MHMPIFLLKKVDAERTRIWTVTLAPQNKLYNRISLKRGVSLLRDFLCLEDRGTFFLQVLSHLDKKPSNILW